MCYFALCNNRYCHRVSVIFVKDWPRSYSEIITGCATCIICERGMWLCSDECRMQNRRFTNETFCLECLDDYKIPVDSDIVNDADIREVPDDDDGAWGFLIDNPDALHNFYVPTSPAPTEVMESDSDIDPIDQ